MLKVIVAISCSNVPLICKSSNTSSVNTDTVTLLITFAHYCDFYIFYL